MKSHTELFWQNKVFVWVTQLMWHGGREWEFDIRHFCHWIVHIGGKVGKVSQMRNGSDERAAWEVINVEKHNTDPNLNKRYPFSRASQNKIVRVFVFCGVVSNTHTFRLCEVLRGNNCLLTLTYSNEVWVR